MESVPEITIIVVCLALSAFFSGSETALLRLSITEVDREAREARGPSILAVRELLNHTSQLLVTILLGNNLVNILAASVASALFVMYLGEQMGVLASTAALTIVVLVFCEVLPKAIAARNPSRFAHAIGLPLYLIHQALRPVHLAYDRILEPLVARVSGGHVYEEMPPDEVLRLALRAGKGQPQGSPLSIIAAAADATDTTVEEIMVARSEIVAFPVDTPPQELLERMLAERFTRFPLYADSIDHFEGIVHMKDLVQLVHDGGRDVRPILKPVLRVPEGKRILVLLGEMQRSFNHIAVVKDEFGNTEGLVSVEDILEELVGEIRDEFDTEELLALRPEGENTFRVLGRVRIVDFNRETGWDLPGERGETVGGMVFNALGRAPHRGDVVEVPGYRLEVAEVSGTRVARVRVRRIPPPEDEGNGASEAPH